MMKTKRNSIVLLSAAFLLVGCSDANTSTSSEEKEPTESERLTSFIAKARTGFKFMGSKKQLCKDLDGNDLFTNTYYYNYSYENDENGVKTKQRYAYLYNGQTQTVTMEVSRSPDGYAAQEYINYKNEVAYSKLVDDDNYYIFYDNYFSNPFLIVDEDDFTFVSSTNDEHSFSLSKDKLDTFDYFLTGNSEPLTGLTITIKDDGTGSIHSESVGFTGRTKDEDGNYMRCTWSFASDFAISSLGDVTLDGAKQSEEKNISELSSLLSSIEDNFTLTVTLVSPTTGEEVGTKKVSYFDGESYYVKADSASDSLIDDYLYHKDPFASDDDSLYEYRYDEASKLWHKSDTSTSTSYNTDPQTKDIFIPHLKEMSVDIFSDKTNSGGYYFVNNESALPFAGEGFFSDAETLSYFSLGYGNKAQIKKDGDTIVALVDFYYPYDSSTLLNVQYKAVYSNIGTTTLPEVDL